MANFPIEYLESDHERIIEEYFRGARGNQNPAASAPPEEARFYSHFVICFVNRSGSNLLARALLSTGRFGRAGEYFNHPQVTRFSDEHGIRSLEDYAIATRARRAAANGIFGTKLGWAQLYYLTKQGIIPRLYRDSRFILMERRDTLGQAISFSIAYQTKAWTSAHQSQQEGYEFDPEDILGRIRGINCAYSRFKQYFAVFGIEPIYVLYEELERDIAGTAQRVIDQLALPDTEDARVDATKISLERQRGELNDEVRKRFLAYTGERLASCH